MLIKNGTIIDGSGRKRFKADIRIEGNKIREIGELKSRRREKVIMADNHFVVPGFVDILNRSDIHFSIFKNRGLRSYVKQGVTTIFGGGCGTSLAPLAGREAIKSIQKWQNVSGININWTSTKEFLDEVERHNISINFGTLTGHATLRRGVVGDYFGGLDEDTFKKIAYMLEKSLGDGSFGLSAGLAYSHERDVSIEELTRLVEIMKYKGGIFAAHLRNEGMNLTPSVNEIVSVARNTGVSTHIFHFKALGKKSWGEFSKALRIIEDAQYSKVPIDFDIYPYERTASVLYLLLPEWASAGGKQDVISRLKDEEVRKKIRDELASHADELEGTAVSIKNIGGALTSRTLGEISENQNASVIDTLINLIVASEDRATGFLPINRENLWAAMRSKAGFIASDGVGYSLQDREGAELVHPRSFGTFPRFLGLYVEREAIMGWEEAINKITFMPAQKIGLKKRGKIERGYFADIVVFNPQNIGDQATFEDPFQYSQGITHVIVNGGFVLRNGKFSKKRYGHVLRK